MMRHIRFLDLAVRDSELKRDLLAAVDGVISHGQIIAGPEIDELEKAVAGLCQKKYCVGVSSGSDALYLSLRALGVGPGDAVITSPMGWVATANAIVLCGATPVFVDVREDMNIDESLIPEVLKDRTKVVLPVHWHGKLCHMDALSALAKKHDVILVEDLAQAICARRNGRPAGSFGRVNALSMNPLKVWGAYGQAGAIVTDDAAIHEKLLCLRYAGTVNKEDCHYPSLNANIDTLQAAMLLVNLKHLPKRIARRREIAHFYTQALQNVVRCPRSEGDDHIYYTYTIITQERDELRAHLESRGIQTRVRQPILIPQQTAYRSLPRPRIPLAERLVKEILSLPIHHALTDDEAEYIVTCVKEFYGAGSQ